jgi:hypothetical protein
MTALALSRSLGLKTSSTSFIVLASNNKLKQFPMVPLVSDDHHHHNENISLPDVFKPMSYNSLKKNIMGGNLMICNPFTSINIYLINYLSRINLKKNLKQNQHHLDSHILT